MKIWGYLCLGILGLALGLKSSFAYVPSSYFIVKSWVDLHVKNRHSSYRIVSRVYGIDQAQQESSNSFKETLIFHPKTEIIKIWATNDHGQLLYYRESKVKAEELPRLILFALDSKSLIQGLVNADIPVLDELKQAAFLNDSQRLKDDQVILKRINEKVSWVFAQKNKKALLPVDPQVWFEKDTFVPLKLVFRSESDSQAYQIQYEFDDVTSSQGMSYPKVFSLLSTESKPLLRSKLSEVTQLAEGSEAGMPHSRFQGLTAWGESSPTELKSLLKLYYEFAR